VILTRIATVAAISRRGSDRGDFRVSYRRAAAAACLISAAGSIPVHALSLFVLLAIVEGRLPLQQAGLISSCFAIGILASTTCLPALGLSRVRKIAVVLFVPALALAILLGQTAANMPLLSWFCMGLLCGVLHLLGSTSAVYLKDQANLFALRLVFVLISAAIVLALAQVAKGFASYGAASWILFIAVSSLCLLPLPWYVEPPLKIKRQANDPARQPVSLSVPVTELLALSLFFSGTSAFSAYAMHNAARRGIDTASLPWAVVVSKFVTALALIVFLQRSRSSTPSFACALMLTAGFGIASSAENLTYFAFGFTVWEIACCIQASLLQKAVVEIHGMAAGRWIPASIAVGASLGPFLGGAMVANSSTTSFVAYCVLSGLLPVVWLVLRGRQLATPKSSVR
jgi:hypothetical protein